MTQSRASEAGCTSSAHSIATTQPMLYDAQLKLQTLMTLVEAVVVTHDSLAIQCAHEPAMPRISKGTHLLLLCLLIRRWASAYLISAGTNDTASERRVKLRRLSCQCLSPSEQRSPAETGSTLESMINYATLILPLCVALSEVPV